MPTPNLIELLTILGPAAKPFMLGIAGFLALKGFIMAFQASLRGQAGEKAVRRVLAEHRGEHDLLLPDGKGGWTQIDHIVCAGGVIVSIETKNFRGMILGGADQARWTQVMGRKRNGFQNPLRQNFKHTKAIQAIVGRRAPVEGLVVFSDACEFPKGMPEGCVRLDRMREALDRIAAAHREPAVSEAAWDALLQRVSRDPKHRKGHLADLQEKHGRDLRRPMGLLLITIGVGLGAASFAL